MKQEPKFEFDEARHRYTLNGFPIPSVTRVIAPLNEFPEFIRQGVLANAARRGTAVHLATELYDGALFAPKQETDEGPVWSPEAANPEVGPYLYAWRRFMADSKFEVHAIEERTYSKRHRYAGTIDRLGVINGARCVLDIKTTSMLDPKVGVQLAAYQHAVNEWRPRAEHYRYRYACQLKKDGTYRLEEYKDEGDWAAFTALLTLYNWRLRFRKGRE